jgi:hypothetical protein
LRFEVRAESLIAERQNGINPAGALGWDEVRQAGTSFITIGRVGHLAECFDDDERGMGLGMFGRDAVRVLIETEGQEIALERGNTVETSCFSRVPTGL